MAFTELEIKDLYVTDTDDIPEEFYGLVLPHTVLYKRAAGFFSSSALAILGRGLKQFYFHGGNMRLIVSPLFSKADYEAIELGYKAREDVEAQKIVEMFDIEAIEEDEGTNILAWLIYEKRLEIRVVVNKDVKKKAIFHDKFSILIDEDGNRITFRGSMNESESAMVDNFESIEVDCSWETVGHKRAAQREKQFDDVWTSGGNNWSTKSIPQAVVDKLIKLRKPIKESDEFDVVDPDHGIFDVDDKYVVTIPTPKIPDWLDKRPYQKAAVREWIAHSNRGIFQMATGTGKTKTSLIAITKVLEVYLNNHMKCGLIIIVPYVVLLEQWLDDLKDFSIYTIPCYESKAKWMKRLEDSISLFNQNARDKLFAITTNKTFVTTDFQKCINSIEGDYIICADEMHHLTSDMVLECLPQNAKYRLGLSATLMTKHESDRINRLKAYFGGIVYEYTMKQAIADGKLTRYYYYPIYVELTPTEKDDYYEVTKKISKAVAVSQGNIDDEGNVSLQALLSQRSRILASADNKLNKLRELAPKFKDSSNLIVYCGDKIEADVKYIDRVFNIINNEIGIVSAKFTSAENKQQRHDIIELFKNKMIQALVAIRCLDEGVDIPQLETAIIMSSGTNPKEFIQRRGRILRKAEGKDFAYIYDFIVIPTLSLSDIDLLSPEERQMEMKVIAREFDRVKEFADLAENGLKVMNDFLKKWSNYIGGEAIDA